MDQAGSPVPQAPLPLLRTAVLPEWIDYNGHMSEAYYVLVFGYATDALLEQIGMDAAYRGRTATSVYTVEAHIAYLHEVRVGEPLRIATQVLDLDSKRVRTFLTMHHDVTGVLLATEELLLLHVDTGASRAAPFAPEILGRLEAIHAAHAALPVPEPAGRSIALRRR
jgi:acyl-CoA thioesterase FadM